MGLDDEVVRVEAVERLEGAPAHGLGSTLFLVAGGVTFAAGRATLGTLAVVVAFLVAANGLSIYAWDSLRERFRRDGETTDNRDSGAPGVGGAGPDGMGGSLGEAGHGDVGGRADGGPGRTLRPHQIPDEIRAELLAGLLIVGSLFGFLLVVVVALEYLAARLVGYLLVAGLGAGNLLVVTRAYRR